MTLRFTTLLLLLFVFHGLLAQEAKKSEAFIKGEQFFREKKYANALTKFEESIAQDKANVEAIYYAAICYLQLDVPESAYEYFKLIDINKTDKLKDFEYWYAKSAYYHNDINEANIFINKYLKGIGVKKYQKEASELAKTCQFLLSAKDSLMIDYVVEPFGEQINTSAVETGIVVSKEIRKLFFNRQNKDFNLKKEGEQMPIQVQLLYSEMEKNDIWASPILQKVVMERLSQQPLFPTSTPLPVATDFSLCQIIEENRRILVCQNDDLKIMDWAGNEWKIINNLEGLNTPKVEKCGFMYDHGNKMIISAESSRGDLDLFLASLRRDGTWGIDKAIDEVNTPYDEVTPFLSNNGKVLYFSSKGHNSIGGYDIFKSEYDSTRQTWQKPVSMGMPINSVGNDWHFSIYDELGFFASDRAGGMGRDDLYRVYTFSKIRMSGKVYNRSTNQIQANCLLKFITDGKIIEAVSEADGSYKVDLPFHKSLEVKVYHGERIMYEENLKLNVNPRRPRYLNRNYYIDEAVGTTSNSVLNSYISGNVKDKKTKKNLSSVVKLINAQSNQIVKTTTTDANGNFNFFISTKGEQYIVEANAKGYIYHWQEIESPNPENNKKVEMLLSAIEPNARFTLRNITFETNSDVLQLSSLTELDKVYEFMMENSKIKVEISGHTDNIGDESMNKNLSERRAASVVRYLVGKGIERSRVLAKGYGSTRPIASNEYEKGGRELNRRIEVMIIE
jgi:outer membrane protein OmpA-like peptidoglycan-associated protein/tetratricopeptide (TPR) repeat protein